jgi:hypothetical protein
VASALAGRVGVASGGVLGRGTYEEDDPVTWEILAFPARVRHHGEPVTYPRRQQQLMNASGAAAEPQGSAKNEHSLQVDRKQGEPELRSMKTRKSEDRI